MSASRRRFHTRAYTLHRVNQSSTLILHVCWQKTISGHTPWPAPSQLNQLSNLVLHVRWQKTNSCQIIHPALSQPVVYPYTSCLLEEDEFIPEHTPCINSTSYLPRSVISACRKRIHAKAYTLHRVNQLSTPILHFRWQKMLLYQSIHPASSKPIIYPDPSCLLEEDGLKPEHTHCIQSTSYNHDPSCSLVQGDFVPEHAPCIDLSCPLVEKKSCQSIHLASSQPVSTPTLHFSWKRRIIIPQHTYIHPASRQAIINPDPSCPLVEDDLIPQHYDIPCIVNQSSTLIFHSAGRRRFYARALQPASSQPVYQFLISTLILRVS